MIRVTAHAYARFVERVANWSRQEVTAFFNRPAFVMAARFGAPYVKLGSGHRAVLDGLNVVTILPQGAHPNTLDRAGKPAECNSDRNMLRHARNHDLRCAGRSGEFRGHPHSE